MIRARRHREVTLPTATETARGRLDRHLQGKLQYAYSRQIGARQQGEQLVALQLTLKF